MIVPVTQELFLVVSQIPTCPKPDLQDRRRQLLLLRDAPPLYMSGKASSSHVS